MSTPSGASIRARMTRMNLIVVIVSIVLSTAGNLYFTLHNSQDALDSTLVNSASILSRIDLIQESLEGTRSTQELAEFLDEATQNTRDIDLILVGDTQSNLLYAPDHDLVDTPYSGTAQTDALAGAAPYTSDETGPMGSEHSAYAPVRDDDGNVIGFIIVGVYFRSMAQLTRHTVVVLSVVGLAAAVVGSTLALRLSKRIKDSLMGYEPDAFVHRFHQREDIMDALEEGIMAIDRDKKLIFLNTAAAEMFSLNRDEVLGKSLADFYPRSTLDRILRTGKPEYNVSINSLKHVRVLADRLPLYEDGQLNGAVSIFRNRTELARMADDLTGVRHMVDAMRAYTHEFLNKLHVILGLLQIGEPEKAQQYIMDTTQIHREAVNRIMNQLHEPSVAALLVGKTSRANELGIRLTLDRESGLSEDSDWLPPDAYVTILGNLIENAIEVLNQSRSATKEIFVSIRENPDSLLLCVEDTGPGIPTVLRNTMFQRGASTKGRHRGTGLSLVQEVVEAYHGDIRVESESGVGTSFFISFCREELPGEKE